LRKRSSRSHGASRPGRSEGARRYLEEALVLAQERGDQRELAAAINAIAQLHRMEGDLDKAEPLYEEVLRLARELGDRESIAIGLLNLAMVVISVRQATAPEKCSSLCLPSPRRSARSSWTKL